MTDPINAITQWVIFGLIAIAVCAIAGFFAKKK